MTMFAYGLHGFTVRLDACILKRDHRERVLTASFYSAVNLMDFTCKRCSVLCIQIYVYVDRLICMQCYAQRRPIRVKHDALMHHGQSRGEAKKDNQNRGGNFLILLKERGIWNTHHWLRRMDSSDCACIICTLCTCMYLCIHLWIHACMCL